MTRMIFLLSLSLILLARMSAAETWITVQGEPMRLKRSTSCSRVAHHKQQVLCDCCVVQNTEILHYNHREATNRCVALHHCVFDEATHDDLRVARREVNKSKKRLNMMSIVDIDALEKAPTLPDDGVLTESNVKNILQRLQKEGHLNIPKTMFNEQPTGMTLFVKPLGERSKGIYSGQLFFIGYKKPILSKKKVKTKTIPLYILKETKKGVSEIGHLYQMNASRLKKERVITYNKHFGTALPSSSTIAKIAFDDVHFKLITNGSTRYFSLLQTAPGKSLNQHLREFGELASTNDSDDKAFQKGLKRIKYIFYRAGFALSQLHQKYADPTDQRDKPIKRTFTHGDLHSENIFYDEEGDLVTLIDNETFALSLKRPLLGIDDIVEFYVVHTFKTIAHRVAKQLTRNNEFGINDSLWHEIWRSLFSGYLDAYGSRDQEQFEVLFNDFKAEFYRGLSQLHVFKSPYNLIDQRKLKRLGPTQRRSKIMQGELVDTFKRLHAQCTKHYADPSEGYSSSLQAMDR